MQNRTDIIGVSLWDRARQSARSHRELFGQIGAVLAGYILAGSDLFGSVAPFGVAFCAAAPRRFSVSAALGVLLGHTFFAVTPLGMKYIVASLMVVVARYLFEPKSGERLRIFAACAIAVISLGVAGSAVLIFANASIYDVLLCVAELCLVCGATYFFSRALLLFGREWTSLARSDISCLAVALAVVLMGLSGVYIASLSLGRILAATVVLLCARHRLEAGGALAGVTAAMALGLAGGDYRYLLIAYGFGGMVAGSFGGMGRIATAASLVFINTVAALFTLGYNDVYRSIFEMFLSSVLFVAIPQGWAARLASSRNNLSADTATQKALCSRISDISEALQEICSMTRQVSEKLGKMESASFTAVYTRTAENVCHRCGMKSNCWQIRFSDTVDAMEQCIRQLKATGTITPQQMPKRLLERCCRLDELTACLNVQFHDHIAKEGVQRKVSKVRGVVTDQFEGVALMLDELAGQLEGLQLLEPSLSGRVEEYFAQEGLHCSHIACFRDEFERLGVEIQIPNYQVARLQKEKATLELSDILETDFDLPQVTAREQHACILFREKATFTLSMGAFQIAAGGGKLCGDAYDYIHNRGGKSHFILSDGMGSGGSAAVDSAMASGLISRLISVGIGHEAALKMVNSALLIKSGEESLATIDVCSLDLFTGKAEFYKAGAAPTFIVKGGKAGYVESTSLPAGILRGVTFEKSGLTLHEGDIVVMVSDGATATGTDWVKSELEHGKETDMQRLSEKIANTARLRRGDGREDDITVVAAQVQRGAS